MIINALSLHCPWTLRSAKFRSQIEGRFSHRRGRAIAEKTKRKAEQERGKKKGDGNPLIKAPRNEKVLNCRQMRRYPSSQLRVTYALALCTSQPVPSSLILAPRHFSLLFLHSDSVKVSLVSVFYRNYIVIEVICENYTMVPAERS